MSFTTEERAYEGEWLPSGRGPRRPRWRGHSPAASTSSQRPHRGGRRVALLPAPGDAQIVRERRRIFIAQLVGKARHRLHALAVREILRADAVEHRHDQVARIGQPQRAVGARYFSTMRPSTALRTVPMLTM
jgi:hypothetical protein